MIITVLKHRDKEIDRFWIKKKVSQKNLEDAVNKAAETLCTVAKSRSVATEKTDTYILGIMENGYCFEIYWV